MRILSGLQKKFLMLVLLISVIISSGNYLHKTWEFWDDDAARGFTAKNIGQTDAFGDQFSRVVYPDQGWSAAQSLWYYSTTQGSNLLPYDFFLVLEQADSEQPFRSPEHINHYRYLVQKATYSNPDGLPIGIVKDTYQGQSDRVKTYIGFTCSTCHTAQLNYNGVAIRIDGGPSAADMVGFLQEMARALENTRTDEAKRTRFVDAVLKLGDYQTEAAVLKELDTYVMRISLYNIVNHSTTRYGYARLDAFGRIYNRLLENLLTKTHLRTRLDQIKTLTPQQTEHIMAGIQGILTSEDREEITRRTLAALKHNGLSPRGAVIALAKLRKGTYIKPDAPVSYPFLWDTPQHDYVQWNGIGANGGVGPLGRNVGEVVGVFGTLDWHETEHCRLAQMLVGQCNLFGKQAKASLIRFDSSANMRNLRKIEALLAKLHSPQWQDKQLADVLPALDPAKMARGKMLYTQQCVACHHTLDRTDPYRKVVAYMSDYKKVGTDPKVVDNSVGYVGLSGFLQGLYANTNGSTLIIQERMPVAALLEYVVPAVIVTPDPDKSWLRSRIEWVFDLYESYSNNDIKASVKQGDYPLDTPHQPHASLQAYKARPLNGIWATAPYLHNGSVPTLYDLLLPATCAPEAPNCEKRPETFMVGSREFDPVKVGFKSAGYPGFKLDTRKLGNHNQGHDYARLNPAQRLDLLEYLKSL